MVPGQRHTRHGRGPHVTTTRLPKVPAYLVAARNGFPAVVPFIACGVPRQGVAGGVWGSWRVWDRSIKPVNLSLSTAHPSPYMEAPLWKDR